jgi:hypothetical protein
VRGALERAHQIFQKVDTSDVLACDTLAEGKEHS